jgi:hypothetical protein
MFGASLYDAFGDMGESSLRIAANREKFGISIAEIFVVAANGLLGANPGICWIVCLWELQLTHWLSPLYLSPSVFPRDFLSSSC